MKIFSQFVFSHNKVSFHFYSYFSISTISEMNGVILNVMMFVFFFLIKSAIFYFKESIISTSVYFLIYFLFFNRTTKHLFAFFLLNLSLFSFCLFLFILSVFFRPAQIPLTYFPFFLSISFKIKYIAKSKSNRCFWIFVEIVNEKYLQYTIHEI